MSLVFHALDKATHYSYIPKQCVINHNIEIWGGCDPKVIDDYLANNTNIQNIFNITTLTELKSMIESVPSHSATQSVVPASLRKSE